MDQTLMLDAARMVHLIGLAGGFGLAIFADVNAFRAMRGPIEEEDVLVIERAHICILVALCLLWASGMVLFAQKTGLDPSGFTPKLVAKFAIVGALTVLAIFVGRIVLPRFGLQVGRTFSEISWPNRLLMSFAAGASLCCWVTALSLGTFTMFKTIDWDTLWRLVGFIFASGIGGAMLTGFAAPVLLPPRDKDDTPHNPDTDIYYVSAQS